MHSLFEDSQNSQNRCTHSPRLDSQNNRMHYTHSLSRDFQSSLNRCMHSRRLDCQNNQKHYTHNLLRDFQSSLNQYKRNRHPGSLHKCSQMSFGQLQSRQVVKEITVMTALFSYQFLWIKRRYYHQDRRSLRRTTAIAKTLDSYKSSTGPNSNAPEASIVSGGI